MTNQSQHPKVELLATSSLKPNPRNARTHSSKQVAQIAASIVRFGWLVPIIVDDERLIAAGHGRWLAAQHLGMDEVPAIKAQFLTDEDRRAFMLAENRIAQLSGWDDKILGEELEILFETGNLEITGFTTADLDLSLPDHQQEEGEAETIDLPMPEAVAVTRPGDLWQVGKHRIYCGDARDPESYEFLLGEDRAGLVWCDPPYNVPINGFVSGTGRFREFQMASGEMSPAEFTAFLRAIQRNCVRFSKAGSIHYHCMDWRHMREMLDAADGVYSAFKQLIVWDKGVGGQGSFYRSQHELIFAFKAGKGPHINNFGLGENGRYRTNVVRHAGANSFRKGRARDLADHSTVKPTALVVDFIIDCSNPGDIVLDPCLGSGTTLIAAHRTRRRGAGIEIDPLYVDTALRRLRDATGLEPVLEGDGRTFDEIAAARADGKAG